MLNAKLVVVGGDAKSAEISLSLPTTIGRGREVTLTLPHPLVSRRHCELFEQDGVLRVRDLKSLNGTYVDSQRIDGSADLKPDHLLTIGNVTFRAIYQVGNGVVDSGARDPQFESSGSAETGGQMIEFRETSKDCQPVNDVTDNSDPSIHDRKTTPGKRTGQGASNRPGDLPESGDTRQPAAISRDVQDGRSHDTPLEVDLAETHHSVCAAMRDAGIAAPNPVAPETLGEIQESLPDVPHQANASGIDGLNPDESDRIRQDDEFTGVEADDQQPSPVNPDESALGSFIRKLPR